MTQRVLRMAGWFKIVSAISMLLMCAAGGYFIFSDRSMWWRMIGERAERTQHH